MLKLIMKALQEMFRKIGYTSDDLGIDADHCEVKVVMDTQQLNIALGTKC